jgi:Mce-associated membrane protein
VAVDADPPEVELSASATARPAEESSAESSSSSSSNLSKSNPDSDVASADFKADTADYDAEAKDTEPAEKPSRFSFSSDRLALAVGLVVVLAMGGLAGWLGFRAYDSHQTQEQEQLFVQVGRQGAINLTTLDWQNADADIQRILDSATGTFHDTFSQRSQPFVDVIMRTQSKTEGTITEASLESLSGDQAQVLVAVQVKTSNKAEPEQEPRFWRMRVSVQKISDDEAKVSDVAFIP